MSALFRLPELRGQGRSFRPDFMWVTRSSSLITPILIEIEKPTKKWFKKDGRPTERFTQAHDQLNDWRGWFAHPENQTIFRNQYLFHERYENRQLEHGSCSSSVDRVSLSMAVPTATLTHSGSRETGCEEIASSS